jgi:hypothetical protein
MKGGEGPDGGGFEALCTRLVYRSARRMLERAFGGCKGEGEEKEKEKEGAEGVEGGEEGEDEGAEDDFSKDGLTALHWAAWHGGSSRPLSILSIFPLNCRAHCCYGALAKTSPKP